MLTREQILARKPKRREVDVPEWGGRVTIQALTVAAAQAITAEDGIVELVVASVVNEDGSPTFSREDRDELRRLELGPCKRIADAVIEFNGMSRKVVEELAENLKGAQNGDSSIC